MLPATYHHGNLRSALIAAALDLVAESGVRSMTLRETARRAGVSHNAPYRHFESKQAILEAIAAEGFALLEREIAARAAKISQPLDRLIAGSLGYLQFAQSHPSHYEVMFAPSGSTSGAGASAFATLESAVKACIQEGVLRKGNARLYARSLWALLHGLATLHNAGHWNAGSMTSRKTFGRDAIEHLLKGLQQAAL